MTNVSLTSDWLTAKVPKEIVEFWRKKYGQAIGCYDNGDTRMYYHESDPGYYTMNGPPPPLMSDILAVGRKGILTYRIDTTDFNSSVFFSEVNMLRRIKLLAFL